MDLVAGLIIEGNKILLVHNTKHNGFRVEPPGGKVENGESLEEAVIRECFEELGIKVGVGEYFGAYKTVSPEGDFTVHTYFCKIVEGSPKVMEPGKVNGFAWYSYGELKGLDALVPNMKEALPELESRFKNHY